MSEQLMEMIMANEINAIIWMFPQYKWKMIAMLMPNKPIATA